MKMIIISIAAAAASFFSVGKAECEYSQQYHYSGGVMVPVSNQGEEYDCIVGAGICTWYKPDPAGAPHYYQPCHTGEFIDLTQ